MTNCPTPMKVAFKSFTTARKHAVMITMKSFRAERPADSRWAYRCVCGMVHLTRRPRWDGRRHVLAARLRPAMKLIRDAVEVDRMTRGSAL